MKALSCICFAISALLFLGSEGLPAQTATSKEYQLKAVFLYNFVQFTEWPTNAFLDTNSPIVIGVVGDDPFGADLDEAVHGEKVDNRSLVVERYRRVEEIKSCHILFISPSEIEKYEHIFATLQGRAILTVGDTEGFARQGGMIRFLTETKRIRLRVNLEAVKAAKLTISSKLLRQVEIVNVEKGE